MYSRQELPRQSVILFYQTVEKRNPKLHHVDYHSTVSLCQKIQDLLNDVILHILEYPMH
jgi:hypothetical protein